MSLISKVEVRFVDIDAFQHVNNAVHLTYAEQARIEYFDLVLEETINWKSNGLILAKSEINYLQPILLKDSIEVATICSAIGSKSITLSFEIYKKSKENQPIVMSKGTTVLVCYNYEKGHSIEVPAEWLNGF
jgi:acyl-CoA thioester hydrolase